jgi:hypothetical protein
MLYSAVAAEVVTRASFPVGLALSPVVALQASAEQAVEMRGQRKTLQRFANQAPAEGEELRDG